MTEKIRQSITEKIQKCLALGQSPNENEAKLAVENANKLLLKYNLTLADITINEDGEVEIGENIAGEGNRASLWKTNLLTAIAENNYCKLLMRRWRGSKHRSGRYAYVLIGKEHNILTVKSMNEYLVEAVDKLSRKFSGRGARAKNSYKVGMTHGLADRMLEIRKNSEKQGVDIDGTHTTALVVKNLHDKELNAINKWLDNKYGRTLKSSSTSKSNVDPGAYFSGINDSKNVSLNKQIRV